jgi:hypothetical protein
MANFITRWIGNSAHVFVSWIVAPVVIIFVALAAAITCITIVVDIFAYLNPLPAFLATLAFASSLVAFFFTAIQDGAPPARWP